MSTHDLEKIIEQFNINELESNAVFGILQYGGGSDESYIESNKEGLELFAVKLLQASKEIDLINLDKTKNTISFDCDEKWHIQESSTFITYIEPTKESQLIRRKEKHNTTFVSKLIPIGCGFIIILLLVSLVIGIVTIIKWTL